MPAIRLNTRGLSPAAKAPRKHSYEGNLQFVKNPMQQLYELAVMTLYGKDTFYESTADKMQRFQALVAEIVDTGNLDFIANTILHARTVMNIRSMPIVLVVEFAVALRGAGKSYEHLRKVTCDVIQRADQITDLYAYALGRFGSKKAIPMALKRGVADAFRKQSQYTISKYNRGNDVKLRDVMRMVHPSPKDETQGALFEALMKDTLEAPYTWEVELTRNGQLPEAERKTKAVLWSELVRSNKLGTMALLRNLRNIMEAGVDSETLGIVCARLSDSDEIAKSKQLPFRFIAAHDAVAQFNDNKLNNALEAAIEHSLGNVPQIGERVWLILDCSLSMTSEYHAKEMPPIKPAGLFAAALAKSCRGSNKFALTMFSDYGKSVPVSTTSSVFSISKRIADACFGGGTQLGSALAMKGQLGFEPDTVVIISDMQVDRLSGSETSIFTKDTVKIAMNLNAYETTPVGTVDGWLQLAGWSDKIFDFIPALRNGQSIVSLLSKRYVGMAGIRSIADVTMESED